MQCFILVCTRVEAYQFTLSSPKLEFEALRIYAYLGIGGFVKRNMRRNLTFVVGRADDLKIVETCLHRLMSTQINALGSWSVVKTMLDRRSLLTLVVLVNAWACPSAVPGGVNECSRRAPFFLTANQRIALCRESNTSAPAECARKAHTAPGLSASLILELCSGVTSDMPGVCVAGIPRRIAATLSSELRVELCRDADSDVSLKFV